MQTYSILSLDGGGIRGYLPAVLLQRLSEERADFLAQIDLFSGTSIGSIIALGLAYGMSTDEICELFEEFGRYIFDDPLLNRVRDLDFTLAAKYKNKHLLEVLEQLFGDSTLGDLNRRVLIPTFDLDNESADPEIPRMWKPKFFHNYPGKDSDDGERIVDVAIRSSAAPFYFPTYQGYVDGFVVANNPSMCAVSQVLYVGEAPLSRIVVLSLGTGINPRYFPQTNADWGWVKWLFQFQPLQRRFYIMPLIYMMWEGAVDTANYQCKQLLGGRFHRLDPMLPKLVDIDEVSAMNILRETGEAIDLDTTGTGTLKWLDKYFPSNKAEHKLAA